MTRKEMAAKANEMLENGMEPREVAAAVGYKTVSGMLGAIRPYATMDAQETSQGDAKAQDAGMLGEAQAPDSTKAAPDQAEETYMLRFGNIRLIKSMSQRAYIVQDARDGDELLRVPFGSKFGAVSLMMAIETIVRDMQFNEDRKRYAERRRGEV